VTRKLSVSLLFFVRRFTPVLPAIISTSSHGQVRPFTIPVAVPASARVDSDKVLGAPSIKQGNRISAQPSA
jgi:hypothetical protein